MFGAGIGAPSVAFDLTPANVGRDARNIQAPTPQQFEVITELHQDTLTLTLARAAAPSRIPGTYRDAIESQWREQEG